MKRLLVLAFIVLGACAGHAQPVRPKADVTPLVEGPARAGSPVRVALKVTVPEGLHTQSNKPRDPTLIPTTVTIDAPAGVTVDEIVWPRPMDLAQAGADQPLSVFEREALIGVRLTLPADVTAGDLTIPVKLRYQACDEKMCYPPTTVDARWVIRVVAAPAAAKADPALASTFGGIKFGTGEKPGPRATVTSPVAPIAVTAGKGRVTSSRRWTASPSPARRADTWARPTFSPSFATRKPGSRRAVSSKAGARWRFCSSCCSAASRST